jgi:putative membrane-bound dehydrogenase-like protein
LLARQVFEDERAMDGPFDENRVPCREPDGFAVAPSPSAERLATGIEMRVLATVLVVFGQFGLSHSAFGQARRGVVLEQVARSRAIYQTRTIWDERRRQLREEFLRAAGMWPLPERSAVKSTSHSFRRRNGYTIENVALETLPGFFCTGNLYRPADGKKPVPAILSPDGHFAPDGRFRADQQIRCAHLARMGAVVFSFSMVGWQDSKQTTHDDPLVLALQTWNSIRAVDFVSGLEGVDPTRIGATGASGGGTQTFYLSAIDERIRASAPVAIVYPWTTPDGCRCEGGLPVMQAAQTNAIELAAAVAPRPQLFISVGGDETRDFPAAAFPFLKHVYGLYGSENLVRNVHLSDEGHDFGRSKRQAVYRFFAEHLGLDSLAEDLSKITLEPPETMAVFSAEHPLPQHAVCGSASVARAFTRVFGRLPAAIEDCSAGTRTPAEGEAYFFTPAGFTRPGRPATATGPQTARLEITVTDELTNQPTPCRLNVVGSDGNFYQPQANHLTDYSLTGQWPKTGKGNRPDKGPYRYLGRFFYSTGRTTVRVPPGKIRVEAFKGFEYAPRTKTVEVLPGDTVQAALSLSRSLPMHEVGYFGGDPHLHLRRQTQRDEETIFDLLEAEDIRYGSLLAYNDPPGPYAGFMEVLDSPQFRGLGERSIRNRNGYWIMSGQEYRTAAYGHLNLHMRGELVFPSQKFNADNWPVYGTVGAETRALGGYCVYAHGGYAQEIYADVVQRTVSAVELLQFGIYRGIGLEDWYHILNTGFRFPCTGASDYPACRFLGDCRTYVHLPPKKSGGGRLRDPPSFPDWLRGMADGRSFVTTGPILLIDVDGATPGSQIDKDGKGPHRVVARVRTRCEVTPLTNLELIVNGRVVARRSVPRSESMGKWIELQRPLEISESSWIAARAYSTTPGGQPDAEAHTNPVYVLIDGRAPYRRESLDVWVSRIDQQIAVHARRSFPEKAKVLAYFQRSRDLLLAIRADGGLSVENPKVPAKADRSGRLRDLVADGSIADPTDEELHVFLERVPAKSPSEAVKTFETAPGFTIQLVASEPSVHDPIAAAFDEDGNLYVCEMRDYPYKPAPDKSPIGSVRLLRDTNDDGVFDESHVFAEKLLWAGGVAPWKGGVFVAAPPDIWYLKDTNGDHRADVRWQVFTGFGVDNQQAMVNNLTWWLDHKVYGSTAGNGGQIQRGNDWEKFVRLSSPNAVTLPAAKDKPIDVNGRDFRFDPMTGSFESITGTVQFGTTFDDWGNRFLCSESQPLQHALLPQHYLERNPHAPVPAAIKNIAPGPIPIFRISAVERWRHIRSSRRIAKGERFAESAGASHHVIDAGAGVTVYRGGAYPPDCYGQVFIADGQNNLIHRRRLIPDGVSFRSERVDYQSEFVRSSDTWFRPVNFVNAPDGTLYCLDMHREVLETIHIPLDVAKHLDLTSGRDRGRIYRIAPNGFRYPGGPRLSRATTTQLVAALESPHGWWRDAAHRLLFERQDKSVAAQLERIARKSRLPQARFHALWSLDGLGVLGDDVLAGALVDPAASIRENAVRLAEQRLDQSDNLRDRVVRLAADSDPRVRLQVAFSLGASKSPQSVAALVDLARRDGRDVWLRTAVLSSVASRADTVLAQLMAVPPSKRSSDITLILESLAFVVGVRNRPDEVFRTLDGFVQSVAHDEAALRRRLLLSLGSGLRQSGGTLPLPGRDQRLPPAASDMLEREIAAAQATARDAAAGDTARGQAVQLLGCTDFEFARPTLEALLDPHVPASVQLETVRALGSFTNDEVARILITRWRGYTPEVRSEAINALLARTSRTEQFLEAAVRGEVAAEFVDPVRRDLLLRHPNPRMRTRAQELFGTRSSPRSAVVAEYRPVLELRPDVVAGEKIFHKHCAACHRLGDKGHELGPDLTSTPNRDPGALLEHILDPNRYVPPNYVQYVVEDATGRIRTGIITAQTATSITFARENGAVETILRQNVQELAATGKSLMPEGLEQELSKQHLADLIGFLQTIRPADNRATVSDSVRERDFGTLPGLIEPDPR